MDFGEFWESMKPLIGDSLDVSGSFQSPENHDGEESAQGPNFAINTGKLAEDMQTLLSGCLM